MPDWAQAIITVAGFLAAWRWVLRPTRSAWRRAEALLSQIRDSSHGVQLLALELHKLAGAVTGWVVRNEDRLTEHEDRLQGLADRIDNLAELIVDVAADVARVQRSLRKDRP